MPPPALPLPPHTPHTMSPHAFSARIPRAAHRGPRSRRIISPLSALVYPRMQGNLEDLLAGRPFPGSNTVATLDAAARLRAAAGLG